jgi:hypothetical protein
MDVFQQADLHTLARLKRQFEAGSGFALLAAIRVCARANMVMPDWVADGYVERYDKILNCHAASWDEVFGKPYPGKHVSELRKRRVLRPAVWLRIREIRKWEPETAIDERLFERVGGEFSIGKTRCGELYYEFERMARQTLPPNSKNSRK